MTRLCLNGIAGQMGDSLRGAAADRDNVTVVVGIGPDPEVAGDVPTAVPADATRALTEHRPDVVLDFSTPVGTRTVARAAAETGIPLVVGTTGLDETAETALAEASETVPVLVGANFARGIHALLGALDAALESLPGYDVEIVETHHSRKQDAPSGTAETILDRVATHREISPVTGRAGHQPRGDDEVAVLARRAGDIRGEHEVLLADNNELLCITHRAEDRGVFAAGALDAAVWLDGRDSGRYTFADVLSAPAGATSAESAGMVSDP